MRPPRNKQGYRSLERIFEHMLQNDPAAPIAMTRAGEPFSALDLMSEAIALKHRMLTGANGNEKWGVYTNSTINGLIALAGLLWAGKQPVLLPNNRESIIRDVTPQVNGFITDVPDFASSKPIITLCEPRSDKTRHDPAQTFSFPADACLQLFTSGSTGQPGMIRKSLAALAVELDVFERAFSSLMANVPVISTVTHQHFYGLMFRLFWPLSNGQLVIDGMLRFPHEVTAMLTRYPGACLISSPAFLKRAGSLVQYPDLKNRKTVVFSSGSPLPAYASCQMMETGRVQPIEIFGSTETGVIAFREQNPQEEKTPWTPLPDVKTRVRAGLLEVASPHLETDDWWTTQDRVEIANDHFVLKGRADRIVKVEEKRVHLGDQENFLAGAPFVEESHIFQESGTVPQLCAVIVPSTEGWQFLAAEGREKFCKALQRHLHDRFEAVTHPRKWHFVKQLPLNPQGKLQLQTLAEYFTRPTVPPDIPDVINKMINQNKQQAVFDLFIPPTLPALQGHFPERAIVAGVVQLFWSDHFTRRAFGLVSTAHKMDRIKFKHLLIPDTKCRLQIRWDQDAHIASFDITGRDCIFAEGRLHYPRNKG